MDLKKLRAIEQELRQMLRSPQGRKASDFVAIATKLGRVRDKRGSEPNYVRAANPSLSPPLSIPGHPGDLKVGTARSIINALLNDLDEWKIFLNRDEDEVNDD